MKYLGIDPGKSGGFAVIHDDNADDVTAYPWDDEAFADVCNILASQTNEVIACVEKVSARPGQGVTSMFNFGKSAGYIEGILRANGIPYQLVPPQKWKKEFSVSADKNSSIAVCKRLFPNVNLYRTPRCTTEHDGMAEALLMAEYAKRKF